MLDNTTTARTAAVMGIDNIPFNSPVDPVELTPDTEIQFDCHRGVECLFGEKTIEVKAGAREARLKERKQGS